MKPCIHKKYGHVVLKSIVDDTIFRWCRNCGSLYTFTDDGMKVTEPMLSSPKLKRERTLEEQEKVREEERKIPVSAPPDGLMDMLYQARDKARASSPFTREVLEDEEPF